MSRSWYSKDAVAGLLFTLLGLFVVVQSFRYRIGDAMHMGPGYFPLLLGGLLVLIGLSVVARAIVSTSSAIESVSIANVVKILGAVVVFGLAVRPLGLVPSIVMLVVLSRIRRGREFEFREVAILATALAAMTALIFVWALGQPINLWPV